MVSFTRIGGSEYYTDDLARLGVLPRDRITSFKVTFDHGGQFFSIMAKNLTIENGDKFKKVFFDTNENYACYGIRPWKGGSYKLNIPEYSASLTRDASSEGDAFIFTYDPMKHSITISGKTMTKTVVVENIKDTVYTPLVFNYYKGKKVLV